MNDRIDEFFKARLTDHPMAPPPNAWSKVEANLSKKNKGIVWFRAAAALLFLGLLLTVIVWVQSKKIETEPTRIANVDSSHEKERAIKGSNVTEGLRPDLKKRSRSNTKRQPSLVQVESMPEIKKQIQQEIEQPAMVEAQNTIEVTESIAVSQPKARKPLVLEFRLDEITTQQLTATEEIKIANVDSKNGIQKAIGFALEVKNGDSPIINLRQAKENLFALNFKKDKKTTIQQ